MPSRHIDNGYFLRNYAAQSIVCCTQCGTAGEVDNHYYRTEDNREICGAKFTCRHCQLSLTRNQQQQDWAGPCQLVVPSTCYYCGTGLSTVKIMLPSNQHTLPSNLVRKCPTCATANHLTINRSHVHHYYEASLAIDQNFGLPLFLQKPCRFGKIWVFNQTHLTELHTYINAELRERSTAAGNGSMISSLPLWMKSAKNREMINKKLGQLQAQLHTYQIKRRP